MNMLDIIRGQGRAADDLGDFRARYERGTPWNGYADQEVLDRYHRVIDRLRPAEFERATWQALERLSTQDRLLFGEYLLRHADESGMRLPGLVEDDMISLQDSYVLAHALARVQQHEPDTLDQLLGADTTPLDSLLVKAVLAGIAAAEVGLVAAGGPSR